jgi:hypothetical protein
MGFGQSVSLDNRIVVIGEATIEIPADKVVFEIGLKFTDSTDVKKAYAKHKEAESKLVNFLKELKIPNKNISYTLISIGKETEYDQETRVRAFTFGTSQNVSVTIEDINKYADFMMQLISAGFTEVSTTFKSSKENDFKETLIQKAIESANKKAVVMAKSANREVKKIVKVLDTDETDPNFGYSGTTVGKVMYAMEAGSNITEIPQTITKSYSVKVVFSLK